MENTIPETYKAPLLLASIGSNSGLESTVAALRMKDIDDLTWESVTEDLIQEWRRASESFHREGKNGKRKNREGDDIKHRAFEATSVSKNSTCTFCGKMGHKAEKCFVNPPSLLFRLPEQAKNSIRSLNIKTERTEKKEKKRTHSGGNALLNRNSDVVKSKAEKQ